MNSRHLIDPLRESSSRRDAPGHDAVRFTWTDADVLEHAVLKGVADAFPAPAGSRFDRVRNGCALGRLRRLSSEPDVLSGDRACPDNVHAFPDLHTAQNADLECEGREPGGMTVFPGRRLHRVTIRSRSVHAAGSMAGRRERHGRFCGACLPHGRNVKVGCPSSWGPFLHDRLHHLFPQCRVRHSRIGCVHHRHSARGYSSAAVGSEEQSH